MSDYLQSAFATHIPFMELALRFVAAIVLGGIIGFEREWRDHAAGLRSHILVSVSAACFAIISLEMSMGGHFAGDQIRFDPMRLVESITAGVAFLAAGFIILRHGEVKGITTGAGMWLAAAIGLASGLGMFAIACVASAIGILTLAALRQMEKGFDMRGNGNGEKETDA